MTTLENRIEEFKTVCKALNLRRVRRKFFGDESGQSLQHFPIKNCKNSLAML